MTRAPAAGAATWTAAGGYRCAEVAGVAGDPLDGSAAPADRWFLVEHPGPWGRIAFVGSAMHPDLVAALSTWARHESGRVLLIRRHGRSGRTSGARRWFRVDSRPGHEGVRTGLFTDERDLVGVTADADAGDPAAGPLYLVCTHGRHDTCCAVRGRPLAAALDVAEPGSTWECSHIGGCRFAAALVLLPHGFVFGQVPADAGVTVARRYRDGELDTRWLRGRSSLPPVVQAAQNHARMVTGAVGVDALRPVGVTRDDASTSRVELADPACTVVLHERLVATGRPLTCAATAPGWMHAFDPVTLSLG